MREEQLLDAESSRMEESSVRTSLDKLCQELNMDEQTAAEAMQNFTAIWNTHTLEVRPVQAFYSGLSIVSAGPRPDLSSCCVCETVVWLLLLLLL